ncbi:MAG: [FeFe] hydrogenase H-cluster radical SAM maturase HydE, partial [Planctomycetota bacterium]|nr:[FeFe] hydrogenase H-cluster radical SAM maturase HydE [Planctomycetota bacterium]
MAANGSELAEILGKASSKPGLLSRMEMVRLLALEDGEDVKRLFGAAYAVKLRHTGKNVSLRGLIEMGNVCAKNCFYCGIRKDNAGVEHFRLGADAVVRMAAWACEQQYGSVVIQSGEIESEEHTELIREILV